MDAPGVTPTRTGWRPRLSNDNEIPLRAACTASEPAARTAHSNAGDRATTPGRCDAASSSTSTSSRGWSSTSRTVRRPRLAVVRQCTRAQRLPDLVVAHARELVARARPERVARTVPEREWARALGAELHQLRLDAQEAGRVEGDAGPDESERILEHELRREAVAPAFRAVDRPATDETTGDMPEPRRRVAESRAALDDRRRHEAKRRLDEDRGLDRRDPRSCAPGAAARGGHRCDVRERR